MALSVLDLFSVGIGPSSSHTVGPMRAAKLFADGLKSEGHLSSTRRVQADMFGSIGATGRGLVSYNAVVLWKIGDESYRIFPRASFAEFLGRWLLDAMREYASPEVP